MTKNNHHESVPAIVLDADTLAAAAAIQSIGRHNIYIVAVSEDPEALGFSSKYVNKKCVSPMVPKKRNFIEYLLKKKRRGVLFFFKDTTAELLSKYQDELVAAGYAICVSIYDTQSRLYDKNALGGIAQRNHIAYPKSLLIENERDLLRLPEKISYPYILKPTKGTSGLYYLIKDRSVDEVATYRRLQQFINSKEYLHANSGIIAQEFVGGSKLNLWNYNALFRGGMPVAEFTGLRIRSNMKKDGTVGSTLLYGRSKLNKDLVGLNRKFFGALAYTGTVETEWGYDEKNHRYILFDVNARPSGNLRWAIAAGVDIPYLYYLSSLNKPVRLPIQKENITYHKFLWFSTDILDALRRWVYGLTNGSTNTLFKDRLRVMEIASGASCSTDYSKVPLLQIIYSNLKALFSPGTSAVDVLDYGDMGPTLKILRSLITAAARRMGSKGRSA